MANEKQESDKKKAVDEEFLMNIMSGEASSSGPQQQHYDTGKQIKTKDKARTISSKKIDFSETFMVNRFPSGRHGKVVYIRPEYHERLLRIVQVAREDKTTLYAYIDNILEYHFREFGDDITAYFNERFKPIL